MFDYVRSLVMLLVVCNPPLHCEVIADYTGSHQAFLLRKMYRQVAGLNTRLVEGRFSSHLAHRLIGGEKLLDFVKTSL